MLIYFGISTIWDTGVANGIYFHWILAIFVSLGHFAQLN